MGAGPWRVYNSARRYLMTGDIDLDDDGFQISLFTGSSSADNLSLQKITDLTGEVLNGNGYTSGGQLMENVTWDVGTDANEMRFSADPSSWNATGGDIVGIQYM